MQKQYLKLVGFLAVLFVVSIGVGVLATYFIQKEKPKEVSALVGTNSTRTPYDMLGTATTPATLTASYSSNSSTILTGYLENLHLDISYKTAASGTSGLLSILVEGSNDGGTTFFPMATKNLTTSSIDLYIPSAVGMAILFPQGVSMATGTTYKGGTDFDLVADYIRVSAKQAQSVTTSTEAGTVYIRTTVTSQ